MPLEQRVRKLADARNRLVSSNATKFARDQPPEINYTSYCRGCVAHRPVMVIEPCTAARIGRLSQWSPSMLVMEGNACWLLLQCYTSGLPDFLETMSLHRCRCMMISLAFDSLIHGSSPPSYYLPGEALLSHNLTSQASNISVDITYKAAWLLPC